MIPLETDLTVILVACMLDLGLLTMVLLSAGAMSLVLGLISMPHSPYQPLCLLFCPLHLSLFLCSVPPRWHH